MVEIGSDIIAPLKRNDLEDRSAGSFAESLVYLRGSECTRERVRTQQHSSKRSLGEFWVSAEILPAASNTVIHSRTYTSDAKTGSTWGNKYLMRKHSGRGT